MANASAARDRADAPTTTTMDAGGLPRVRSRELSQISMSQQPGFAQPPADKRMRSNTNNPFDFGSRIPGGSADRQRNANAEAELLLHAPFTVSANVDAAGRVNTIQYGEFLFAIDADRSKMNCLNILSLTQLNQMLMNVHLAAQEKLRTANWDFHSVLKRGEASASPDSIIDMLQRMLPEHPMTPAALFRRVTYLGPMCVPTTDAAATANAAGRTAGLRLMSVQARGRATVPNLWMAYPGTRVGFVVKRFVDPRALRNVTPQTLMQVLGPIQVYPCVASLGRALQNGRLLCRSTLQGEVRTTDRELVDSGMGLADINSQRGCYTSAERSVAWNARDPWSVDGAYIDYKIEAVRQRDNTYAMYGTPEFCAGMYIHVGVVAKMPSPLPSVAAINAAVLGVASEPAIPAHNAYIQMLNDNRIDIQVQGYDPHAYMPADRVA